MKTNALESDRQVKSRRKKKCVCPRNPTGPALFLHHPTVFLTDKCQPTLNFPDTGSYTPPNSATKPAQYTHGIASELKPVRHATRPRYRRSEQPSRSLGRRRHVLSAPRHGAQVGFLHHCREGRYWSCLLVVGIVVLGVEGVVVIGGIGII